MTTKLPSGYTFGKVVGQAIRAVGDQPEDTDYFPEAQPIVGKKCVVFTPRVPQVVTPDNGVATMVMQDKIDCDMNANGQLIRNSDDTGDLGVWLYTGVWTVSFNGVMTGIQSFDILVTEFHAEDPLDLFANMATPIPPSDPVTTLVVPSGGATGDILTWDPSIGGLKWVKPYSALPRWWAGTQAQYDALEQIDPGIVYVITPDDITIQGYWNGTQAEYDSLASYSPNTLYFISESS